MCAVSNENEIGMGRLFNRDTGLRYVQDTQIIMKGCEELILYTESWTGSCRYVLAQEYTSEQSWTQAIGTEYASPYSQCWCGSSGFEKDGKLSRTSCITKPRRQAASRLCGRALSRNAPRLITSCACRIFLLASADVEIRLRLMIV